MNFWVTSWFIGAMPVVKSQKLFLYPGKTEAQGASSNTRGLSKKSAKKLWWVRAVAQEVAQKQFHLIVASKIKNVTGGEKNRRCILNMMMFGVSMSSWRKLGNSACQTDIFPLFFVSDIKSSIPYKCLSKRTCWDWLSLSHITPIFYISLQKKSCTHEHLN